MKKNIILLSTVTALGIIFLEYFASFKINRLIKRNGYTKELIEFYNHYYKELHHLGRLNEADAKNPSSLMFDKIGDGKVCIIIQGDSWAEQYREDESKNYLKQYLERQNKYKFILAGTGSYSPSIMTSQLFILRNDFDHHPEILIAVIDQTDIGDEICRYKKLRKDKEGKIIVEPEDENSIEYNSGYYIINNFKMFFSDHYSLVKIFYYLKNNLKSKRNQKRYQIRCNKNQILGPLKNGVNANEEKYLIDVFQDYFHEAFSSPALKKLILVTHPHKKHLSGEYVLNIDELILKAKSQSKFNENIKIVSFAKQFKSQLQKDPNNIFVDNDAYSHLKKDYFLTYILPEVITEINLE